jgi:hypothetical protein
MVRGFRSCQHGEVQELPPPITGGALDRRQRGELTPLERAVRRKNRRWMTVIVVPAVLIGVVALIASLEIGSGGSSVHPIHVPPGYRSVSDGYFAYAVPAGWSQSSAYTDDVGDLDTQGSSGWAAEHLGGRQAPPTAAETPPASFATFGESRPIPFQLGPASPVRVRGATVAYQYTLTRPGGFQAVAIDAWQASSGAQIWLLVRADPATTAAVIGTLNA